MLINIFHIIFGCIFMQLKRMREWALVGSGLCSTRMPHLMMRKLKVKYIYLHFIPKLQVDVVCMWSAIVACTIPPLADGLRFFGC